MAQTVEFTPPICYIYLPVIVEVVDKAERIETIQPALEEMVSEGLITQENVHVIKHVHITKKDEI